MASVYHDGPGVSKPRAEGSTPRALPPNDVDGYDIFSWTSIDSNTDDPVRPSLALMTLLGPGILGCGSGGPVESSSDPTSADSRNNVLLIIADDMGKDATAGFAEGAVKPRTPHLDALAANGLVFANLWVAPTCAPTRASILTGRYGFRTGVTRSGRSLPPSETTLQRYISEGTGGAYATAVVGKWHLARSPSFNPETLGIDYYAGVIEGNLDDYYSWPLTEDGVATLQAGYNTEVLTDLAIDWIADQDRPWFMWLAYNAPHGPFHVPPAEMHSQGALPEFRPGGDGVRHFMAAIEAMDYQIGRLLDSLTPAERAETTIVFIGDNGSPGQVAQDPYPSRRVKGTLYQGGINTPMYVSGPGVTRRGIEHALVGGTDLFATIAGLAGVEVTEVHDARSLVPLFAAPGSVRPFVYSLIEDDDEVSWTVRDDRYKLLVGAGGVEQMFDLTLDPYESTDLVGAGLGTEASAARAAMRAWADSIGGRPGA